MTRKSWALDTTIGAVVLVLGQLEAWWGIGASHRQGPAWAQATLYAVTAAVVVFRRVAPVHCLFAILVASLVEFSVFGSPEGNSVALPTMIVVYTIGSRYPLRRSWWALPLALLMWLIWAGFDPASPTWTDRLAALMWVSLWVICWLVGALVRVMRLNAEQRRIARAQQASRAVAEERNRIARELHDVIGHSVTVMTVQTSAVRRRLTPEQDLERQTLQTVESVGREALAEMRRMIGVLRTDEDRGDLEPAPGLDQLDRLVEKFRSAGLPVTLTTDGAARPLAPSLDLTAYRLVQEGLTNTLRHAAEPEHVEVGIGYGDQRLRLSIRDDGSSAAADGVEPGDGLLGMRERVAVYGGEMSARFRPEGGFELVADLPLEPT